MRIKLVLLTSFLLAIGVITIVFSNSQKQIDPTKLTGEYDFSDTTGQYLGEKIATGEIDTKIEKETKVLGISDRPKRIEVDLTNQRLYAYEGNELIYNFLVSTGKWGKTPTGTFQIWGKFRYTKMEGGSKELNTYYYLPNVPYTMFFANDKIPTYRGFGIHGTYWHDNFGHPMSHGCVNMKTEEAGLLYNWASPNLGENKSGRATTENPGTEVIIYGVAPKS